MSEYVEDCVGALVSTEESSGGDFITISRDEYERLVRENEEFRCMLHEVKGVLPKLHESQRNIEEILKSKGVDV